MYELQSGLIDARLAAEFERQEAEDAYRLGEGLEAAVNDEFENGGRVMQKIREFYERRMGHGVSGKGDDSVKNRDVAAWIAAHGKKEEDVFSFSIRETLVRVSAEFSIRKHTTCQMPYFHGHDFYEMIYVWRGRGGQKVMGAQEALALSEGDLCILTPGMVHAMLPCRKGDLILKIIIPCPMMREMLGRMEEGGKMHFMADSTEDSGDNFVEFLKKKNELYIFRGVAGMKPQTDRLIEALMQEAYWGTTYQGSAIQSLLVLLLVGLNRGRLKRGDVEHTNEGILKEVFAYVRGHLQDANLEELAALTGYSGRQLRRKIAESTGGGTFSDILQRTRMEEAATLLNGTDISVEEVAKIVGYQATAGFYKRFSEVFHMTPAAYRKMYMSPGERDASPEKIVFP